jgi:hypothetical protein
MTRLLTHLTALLIALGFALGFLLGRLLAPRLLTWLLNAWGSLAGSPLHSPAVLCDGGNVTLTEAPEYGAWIDGVEKGLQNR